MLLQTGQVIGNGIYRSRVGLSVLLLVVLWFFMLSSLVVFPLSGVTMGWRNQIELVVYDVEEAPVRSPLRVGDIVTGVNGVPVERGRRVFPTTDAPTYELALLRDGEPLKVSVMPRKSRLPLGALLEMALLAGSFWVLGFLTIWAARDEQRGPVAAGFIFQIIGVGIVSPYPGRMGVPGAWIFGHVLVHFFPLMVMYLGFLPRTIPISRRGQWLLGATAAACGLVALLAAWERLVLFPTTTLLSTLGLDLWQLSIFLTGAAVVALLGQVGFRMYCAPRGSYLRRQLTILLFLMIVAALPILVLVTLPRDEADLMPWPLLYGLLLLLPAGYFFVFHRQGYLALEPLFCRLITVAVLLVGVTVAYASGLALLAESADVALDGVEAGTFLFLLALLAIVGQPRMQSYVETLVYGTDPLDAADLRAMAGRLAISPDPLTVQTALSDVARRFQVGQVLVVGFDNGQWKTLAAADAGGPLWPASLSPPAAIWLRSTARAALPAYPAWLALAQPIRSDAGQGGMLLLSAPAAGYFNARQVLLLGEVADVLAPTLQVIELLAIMQTAAQQAMYENVLQRQLLATEIHNEPLQTLAVVIQQLAVLDSTEGRAAAQTVRQVTRDLRRIVSGLRPAALARSLAWMVRHVARDFAERHPDLRVVVDVELPDELYAAEAVRFAVYFVLSEALNNIARHAQAGAVWVNLRLVDQVLRLDVADDGVGGIATGRSLPELLREQHFGLADCHHWADLAGGSFVLAERLPHGALVSLSVPLSDSGTDPYKSGAN